MFCVTIVCVLKISLTESLKVCACPMPDFLQNPTFLMRVHEALRVPHHSQQRCTSVINTNRSWEQLSVVQLHALWCTQPLTVGCLPRAPGHSTGPGKANLPAHMPLPHAARMPTLAPPSLTPSGSWWCLVSWCCREPSHHVWRMGLKSVA